MDKPTFVANKLGPMLKAANTDISEVEYRYIDTEEYVFVLMKNNAEYKICVTANNLMSISADVIDFMRWR